MEFGEAVNDTRAARQGPDPGGKSPSQESNAFVALDSVKRVIDLLSYTICYRPLDDVFSDLESRRVLN